MELFATMKTFKNRREFFSLILLQLVFYAEYLIYCLLTYNLYVVYEFTVNHLILYIEEAFDFYISIDVYKFSFLLGKRI